MNYEYILTLAVLCLLFAVGIYLMKYIRNAKLANLIFIALVYIPYVCMCVYVYKTDTDVNRWNFLNTLPVANVSPFMFSLMPILLILPEKIRKHLYLLVSMLTVGMLLSTVFGCVGNALRNYKFHFHFTLDYFSHFAMAAFGIFLIRSKQIILNVKNCIISGSIIYGVATIMLIMNVIFDKAFFGLSLNGKHSIYNIVLVDNSYLSALIYYVGLFFILLFGAAVCKLIDRSNMDMSRKSF